VTVFALLSDLVGLSVACGVVVCTGTAVFILATYLFTYNSRNRLPWEYLSIGMFAVPCGFGWKFLVYALAAMYGELFYLPLPDAFAETFAYVLLI
jgi:hypothetical protein